MLAKNRETAQLLTSLFRMRKVYKTYLAICHGEILKNSGKLKDYLVRYEKKREIKEYAETFYKVLDKNSTSTLLELKPITGRKHQLRKQLHVIGHPIFGDEKYKIDFNEKSSGKKLMLHSYEIKFMINNKKYTYRASLPEYFEKLLNKKRLIF